MFVFVFVFSEAVARQTGRQLPVGGRVLNCTQCGTHSVGSDLTANSHVLKFGAKWCSTAKGVVQCGALWCNVEGRGCLVQCGTLGCSVMQFTMLLGVGVKVLVTSE